MDEPGSYSSFQAVFAANLGGANQLSEYPICRRLYDQYVASRFSAFSDPRNDLRDSDRVIRYARELFDDEQPRRAIELIRIAIEEDQSQRAAAGARSAFCCAARRVSGGELPANERSRHLAFFIRFLKALWN